MEFFFQGKRVFFFFQVSTPPSLDIHKRKGGDLRELHEQEEQTPTKEQQQQQKKGKGDGEKEERRTILKEEREGKEKR